MFILLLIRLIYNNIIIIIIIIIMITFITLSIKIIFTTNMIQSVIFRTKSVIQRNLPFCFHSAILLLFTVYLL